VAPPPRSRLASSTSLPAPPTQLSHQTRQRRPDPPASTKEKKASISAESRSESSKTDASESDTDTSSTDNDDEHQADDDAQAFEQAINEGILFLLLMFHYISTLYSYSEIYDSE
jgi:hypothetical protein